MNPPFGCALNSLSSAQEWVVCRLLRNIASLEHISTAHSPAGTKLYQCEHSDCSKSFGTNQKLRAHQKTHDEKRYVCSHPSCLLPSTLQLFSTWTKLQAHMKAAHPPTCPYPGCNSKSFSQQKSLKVHLKIYEGRTVDGRLDFGEDTVNDDEPRVKKRRGGEHGMGWVCDFEGCTKDFKSVLPLSRFRRCVLMIVL